MLTEKDIKRIERWTEGKGYIGNLRLGAGLDETKQLCADWRALAAQVAALESELAKYQEVAAKENTLLDAWIAKAGEHQRQVAELTDCLEERRITLCLTETHVTELQAEMELAVKLVAQRGKAAQDLQAQVAALTADLDAARQALAEIYAKRSPRTLAGFITRWIELSSATREQLRLSGKELGDGIQSG